MRRISRWTPLALAAVVTLGLAVPGLAQDTEGRHPVVRHHLRGCLSILDLTDAQKETIAGILEAARPALEADASAVRAAREALRAALETEPPDACAIGEATVAVRAAVDALRQEWDGVWTQIASTLTPEQKARLEGCIAAPRPGPGEPGTPAE